MDAVLEWVRAVGMAVGSVFASAPPDHPVFYGYVEADYQRVAPAQAGVLTVLNVTRGGTVRAGDVVAQLAATAETAAVAQVTAQVAQAESQLADLRKGQRSPELDALQAQRGQAAADLQLSEANFNRQTQLNKDGVATKGALDTAKAAYDRDRARISQLDAQIRAANMGARADQIAAAEAAVAAQRAALTLAQFRLSQRTLMATSPAIVSDTLFTAGEFVPAGAGVVSLLPAAAVKVRFFLPETAIGAVRIGASVRFACDGCAAGMTGKVDFIATQPEYTPPIIYSRESRAKLVFLVEVRPDRPDGLHPGQPVEVDTRP